MDFSQLERQSEWIPLSKCKPSRHLLEGWEDQWNWSCAAGHGATFPVSQLGSLDLEKWPPPRMLVGNEGFKQDSLPNMVILLMVTDDCILERGVLNWGTTPNSANSFWIFFFSINFGHSGSPYYKGGVMYQPLIFGLASRATTFIPANREAKKLLVQRDAVAWVFAFDLSWIWDLETRGGSPQDL